MLSPIEQQHGAKPGSLSVPIRLSDLPDTYISGLSQGQVIVGSGQ